jgi:prevent-host-death family protein
LGLNDYAFVTVTEAKAKLFDLIEQVAEAEAQVVITRNGRPVAVLLPPALYEGMEETIDILGSDDWRAALLEARRDAAAGDDGEAISSAALLERVRAERKAAG